MIVTYLIQAELLTARIMLLRQRLAARHQFPFKSLILDSQDQQDLKEYKVWQDRWDHKV